jgi:LuxR family glucitol operon transcriptional activator
VLITSRKGLGEIERRYPLPNFSEKDAKTLFRLIAKERERIDLLKLSDETIGGLVKKKVRYYPLLIKWSIGKVFLGKGILEAFTEIYSGKSEIAEFVFNDIFEIFSQPAKLCLYSMIIIGDRPISKHLLMHLANLDDDTFDDAIRELTITSFVYPDVSDTSEGVITNYQMLSLTRGFVTHKLDEDKKTLRILQTRYYDLSRQIELLEKSQSEYNQSLFSLGVKTEEEKIAFNYVKTAKNYIKTENFEKGTENFENAIEIAPNFSYALIEYAKFEFDRGHIPKSNELFQRAVDADKENFHAFFGFGICLRRQKSSLKQ